MGEVIPPAGHGAAFAEPFDVLDGHVSGDSFTFSIERTGIGGTGPDDRDATYHADWTGKVSGLEASGSIDATLEPGTLDRDDGFAAAREFDMTRPGFKLSGTVVSVPCGLEATSCPSQPSPVSGVDVKATGASDGSAITDDEGNYSITLPKGTYTVTPSYNDQHSSRIRSR